MTDTQRQHNTASPSFRFFHAPFMISLSDLPQHAHTHTDTIVVSWNDEGLWREIEKGEGERESRGRGRAS